MAGAVDAAAGAAVLDRMHCELHPPIPTTTELPALRCGITFTFGGLKIDTGARVISTDGIPIPGLCAAGELVGGIFYFNYPGGTGLTNGAMFGRIAGTNAARGSPR
jgi:succinate dehydrogenase/fumarate reductase flavoprotein subunit